MHFFSSKFKKFDIIRKTQPGIQNQTLSGAVVTVVATILVLLLVINEFREYNTVTSVSTMVPDHSVGIESTEIHFGVQFLTTKCTDISYRQAVTRGTVHTHDNDNVVFTEKDGGCFVNGDAVVDKVDGNIFLVVKGELGNPIPTMTGTQVRPIRPTDMAHEIKYLRFVPKVAVSPMLVKSVKRMASSVLKEAGSMLKEEISYPEESSFSSKEVVRSNDNHVGVWNYAVRVVGAQKHYRNNTAEYMSNVFVQTKPVSLINAMNGVSVGGQLVHMEIGLLFTYEFYPIMLEQRERKKGNFFQFITSLCAIIGGTVTVLGLIDRFIHSSTKQLMGKKD
jgi:hypothetical protein